MAKATCIKCGSTDFEVEEAHIHGADVSMRFVQCTACGGVVGALPSQDTNELIRDLARSLGVRVKGRVPTV